MQFPMEQFSEIGCSFHVLSQVLICQTCEYGLHIGTDNSALANHFRTYHASDQAFLSTVAAIVNRLGLRVSDPVPNPPPFQPPVPYLKIVYGWYCRRPLLSPSETGQQNCLCTYLTRSTNKFMRHQRSSHAKNKESDFRCQKVLMQSFFQNRYQSWFPVSDISLFDHRPIISRRPAWHHLLEDTIQLPRYRQNVHNRPEPEIASDYNSFIRATTNAEMALLEER